MPGRRDSRHWDSGPGGTIRCLSAACASQAAPHRCTGADRRHPEQQFSSDALFSTYRTYSLAPGPDGRKLASYSQTTLRSTIRTPLAARGVAKAAQGQTADIAIVWHGFLTDKDTAPKAEEPWFGTEWPYEYGFYTVWTGAPTRYTNTDPYPDGTLILDVVDTKTKRLVSRRMATAMVVDTKRSAKNIEKAVAEMIEALSAKH